MPKISSLADSYNVKGVKYQTKSDRKTVDDTLIIYWPYRGLTQQEKSLIKFSTELQDDNRPHVSIGKNKEDTFRFFHTTGTFLASDVHCYHKYQEDGSLLLMRIDVSNPAEDDKAYSPLEDEKHQFRQLATDFCNAIGAAVKKIAKSGTYELRFN